MTRWFAIAAALVGCGDNDHTQLVVAEVLGAEPSSVWVRSGDDGAWLAPTKSDDPDQLTYTFEVLDDIYTVVTLCNAADSVAVNQLALAAADGPTIRANGCFSFDPGTAPTVHVAGSMLQPGRLALGIERQSTSGPWTYGVDLYSGTYDLLADDTDRIAIRRDQQITGTPPSRRSTSMPKAFHSPRATPPCTG